MQTVDDAALESCDSEPIHIPGLAQSFGCLIAFDRDDLLIVAISQNCADFVGKSSEECIGAGLDSLFDHEVLHSISNKLAFSTIRTRREYAGTIDAPETKDAAHDSRGALDIFVHAGPRFDYLELIESSQTSRATQSRIAALTSGMQRQATLEDIFTLATDTVHSILRPDRTVFLRNMPDGTGDVVAEVRSGHLEPLLGLRYPKWDIPKQARRLYSTTPIRTIANVKDAGVPVAFAKGLSAEDFDLSFAVTRGTSPIHLEYLTNMKVAASMTIPVVVDGKLWGLISSHMEKPRFVGMDMLDTGEVIGHIISFGIGQVLRANAAQIKQGVADIRDDFIGLQSRVKTPQEFVEGVASGARGKIDFDGVGFAVGSDWHSHGIAPDTFTPAADKTFSVPSKIADLEGSTDAAACMTSPEGTAIAGYLEIPLVKDPATRIVFFRKAIRSEVSWAGLPQKDIEEARSKPRLSPRKSFAKYIAQHGDRSAEWSASDVQYALGLQEECASSQSAAGRIMQQKDNLRILADELNHRVKNILALVKSLSSHARESSGSAEEYAQSLEQRLFSLSASHDLLTREEMESVSLRALIKMELEPILPPAQIEASLSGPDALLAPDSVPMATLLTHELASNAARHGALSVQGGRVEISWRIEGDAFLFDWRERGGPAVTEPNRQGFGMELLKEAIPFEFNGTADLNFAADGLHAQYRIPVYPFLRAYSKLSPAGQHWSSPAPAVEGLEQGRALVLEDSYLLASEHSKILGRIGFDEVDKASSVASAISIIERSLPSFALLDVNLRDEMSFAVADLLIDRGVPFVFVTGYGSITKLPGKFASVPMLKKPLTADSVTGALPALTT